MTAQEYLALERKAETKSEFVDGEMFAMAGGTRKHSRVAVSIAGLLNSLLVGKPCEAFNSDMRVKIEATGLYTYPDVTVACGQLRFEDSTEDVLLNPKIILEVVSDSTAAWDREFWHYRHLESLAEYVLASQDAWRVEHYIRKPDGTWLLQTVEGAGGVLSLISIKAKLSLAECYAKTGLKPPPTTNHVSLRHRRRSRR